MADDLSDHFQRVDWTRKQIQNLQTEIKEYRKSKPFEISHHHLPSVIPKTVLRLKETAPIPLSIAIFAGVLANELRTILDGLCSTLAIRNQRTTNSVYFPITETRDKFFEATAQEKIRKLSAADKASITAFQPWSGGNDLLYALHVADVTRKHTRLISMASTSKSIGLWEAKISTLEMLQTQGDVSKGFNFAIVRDKSDITFAIDLTLAYSEPAFLVGKDVIVTLNDFADLVDSILKAFN